MRAPSAALQILADGRDLRNPLPVILTPQLPSRPFSELVSLESERRLPRQSPALPSPVPRLKFSPHTHVRGPGSQMLSSAPGVGVGHRDPHGGSVGVQQQQQDTPHRPGFAPSPNSELLGSGTPAPPYRGPRSGSVEGRGVHGGVRSVRPPDLPSELLFLGTQTPLSAQLWRPGAGDPRCPRSRPRSLLGSSASGLGGHRCQREARRLPGQRRRGFPRMSAPRNRPRAPGPCGPAPAGDKLASGNSWLLPTDAGPTGRGCWQGRPASPQVRHTPRPHPAVMPRGPRGVGAGDAAPAHGEATCVL